MLPRSIAKASKPLVDASIDALPTASTSTVECDPGPSAPAHEKSVNGVPEDKTPIEDTATSEVDEDELDRREDIRFEIEVALSDWGLARVPALLTQIRTDSEQYVPISDLVDQPPLKRLRASPTDVVKSVRDMASESVELSDDGHRLRRRTPVNETALAYSLEDWARMSLYVEGIPRHGHRSRATPATIRALLSEVFGVPVQTVRFPPLFDKDRPSDDRSASGDASLYESHPHYQSLDKATRRVLRMPEDGGPYKGFAFVVLADKEATERVLQTWAFDRDVKNESASVNGHAKSNGHAVNDDQSASSGSDSEDDQETTKGPTAANVTEQARRTGLKVMPLTEWNELRAAYLSYKRALEKLEDDYADQNWRQRERRRDRDRYDRNSRRRDDEFWSGKSRSRYPDERDDDAPRPSDADKWGKRSPTPEETTRERIPGSLVQLKNISRSSRPTAIRYALTALLDKEHPDLGASVHHVDQAYDSIRATVCCSSVEAATALVGLFSGDPRMHSDPLGEDEDAFELMGPMDEVPSVKASLLTADEEQAYWAESSRHAANGIDKRDDRKSKRRGDHSEKPKSKHTRFD